MLAARAIRKKKSKTEQEKKDLPRGPYIKPFGPRFDSSELPYFKYGVATQNCTLEMEFLCNSLARIIVTCQICLRFYHPFVFNMPIWLSHKQFVL